MMHCCCFIFFTSLDNKLALTSKQPPPLNVPPSCPPTEQKSGNSQQQALQPPPGELQALDEMQVHGGDSLLPLRLMMQTSLPPKVARRQTAKTWKHYVRRQDEPALCFSLLAGSCGSVPNDMASDSSSWGTYDKNGLVSCLSAYLCFVCR